MPDPSKKYFVVQTIWHEGQRRHAYPGELVELPHLSEAQVTALVAANVIVAEEQGRGRFGRNLSADRPPLPPEVVAAALEQAATDSANAQADPQEPPATAKKRSPRKSKE
jgi:hypothetical protein